MQAGALAGPARSSASSTTRSGRRATRRCRSWPRRTTRPSGSSSSIARTTRRCATPSLNRASRSAGARASRRVPARASAAPDCAACARPRQRSPRHLAPVFGASLAALDVERDATLRLHLHGVARGLVSAAVRLGAASARTRASGLQARARADARRGARALRASRRDWPRRRPRRCTICSPAATSCSYSRLFHPDRRESRCRTTTRTARRRTRSHARAVGGPRTLRRARGRACARPRATRPFTVGIGGPVGSGKTALLLELCRRLRDRPAARGRDERHLHPRGRRVPDPPRRAARAATSARSRRAAARTPRSART